MLFCTKNNIIYSSQLFNERDMTMKKRVVVALGHRALGTTLPEQKVAVKNTSKVIADLIEAGFQVAITHSNAPQVEMCIRDRVSIEEVASSRINISGILSITLAIHKSCFCPCDRFPPSS